MAAVLVARLEQHLQAQADPQKRPAGLDGRQHGPIKLAAAQLGNGVLEGPHARQDDLVGRGHHGRVAGDDGQMSDLLKSLLHAPQVAHAVVDDGDHSENRVSQWWRENCNRNVAGFHALHALVSGPCIACGTRATNGSPAPRPKTWMCSTINAGINSIHHLRLDHKVPGSWRDGSFY